MDIKAHRVDNVIIEHWFHSLKCKLIYINEFNLLKELRIAIGSIFKSITLLVPMNIWIIVTQPNSI